MIEKKRKVKTKKMLTENECCSKNLKIEMKGKEKMNIGLEMKREG